MTPVEPQGADSSNSAAEPTFEDVRESFLFRLHSEAERLGVLADSLESSDRDAALVFGDLEAFAHRLRGAAAVFDARELSADAKSLELAVAAASHVRGRRDDRYVIIALRTLAARLAQMNGGRLQA